MNQANLNCVQPERRERSGLAATILVICLLGAFGCGGGDFATVKGIAKLDGKPIDGGTVMFVPEGSGPVAYSGISTEGAYELRTGSSSGLKPGKYIATVSHRRGHPSPKMTVAQIEALELVPVRYTTKTTSDLHWDVASGSNRIDLELTSTR